MGSACTRKQNDMTRRMQNSVLASLATHVYDVAAEDAGIQLVPNIESLWPHWTSYIIRKHGFQARGVDSTLQDVFFDHVLWATFGDKLPEVQRWHALKMTHALDAAQSVKEARQLDASVNNDKLLDRALVEMCAAIVETRTFS